MAFKKFKDKVVYKIKDVLKIDNNKPKIYWCKSGKSGKNFGDLITSYIYMKITGNKPVLCDKKNTSEPVYFGSGSILKLMKDWTNVIVWSSGIMNSNDTFDKPKKILCVRGPLTRKRFLELGYECPEIYGDLGLLLPKFYNVKFDKKYQVGIIPHFVDFEFCKKLFSKLDNIIVIDVCNDIEEVVNNICKCELTISSSLHGIIVSHAYNIKSCWAKFSDNILGDNVKYFDYYYSVNLTNVKKPIIIGREINSQPNAVNYLVDIIENYPNPTFPINTEKLMKTCPF